MTFIRTYRRSWCESFDDASHAGLYLFNDLNEPRTRSGGLNRVITDAEFKAQLSTERANYLAVLKRMQ